MPFWRNLLSNALLFSLQDSSIKYGQHALNSRKPKDRIAGWIRRWICPGRKKASRRALPAGMTVEAAVVLPVFLFAVANLLSLFLVFWSYSSKEAQLHQTARQIALYAYGQEDGEPDVRLMRLTPGLCAIWDCRFSEQLCRKRVRDAQMDWLQRGRDGRRLGTAGRRAGLYYKIRRSLSPGTELSLFESVHPPCRPGGNNSRLYTMQRMCRRGTVGKSADLCDGRRKQIS